jgi:DNA-binding NarL/FixJ family response regulator
LNLSAQGEAESPPKRPTQAPARSRLETRILLADDHPPMLQALRDLLELGGHQVVGAAGDGRQALKLARALQPDIIILDLSMPRLNGVDTALEIRRWIPGARTLVLTAHDGREHVLRALRAGARGYVLKTQAAEELLRAVKEVAEGRMFLSSGVDEFLVDAYLDAGRDAEDPLTSRERQVLQLIAEGHTAKQAARLLCIDVKTVESHRNNIMRKLGVHDVTGLVRHAVRRGLVQA